MFEDASTELSSRRTGMSFQRTRLSADRTLMSVIRTSLSLISFGFTIHQVFERLQETAVIAHAASGRNFGISLVALGVLMLVLGVVYHVRFMLELRRQRVALSGERMIHGDTAFPPSMTLVVAVFLLLLGLVAISSMVFRVGPFD